VAGAGGEAERDLIATYRVLWRMYSGTAHALRWSVMHRIEILGEFARGDASGRLTAGDLPELSISASAMVLLIGHAINQYEQRRQRP
jgi:hypothetical protein